MSSGFCSNCGEPLAPHATFCPNCGTKVAAPTPDQQATQPHPPPPPPSALNSTVRASAPPAGDFPPAYGGAPTVQAPPPAGDAYASQYAAPPPPSSFSQYSGAPPSSSLQPPSVPPPVYVPGPPPPVTPGGVAPWAQPQKARGRRNVLVVFLVVVVLLAACGGGVYAYLNSKSKSRTTGTGTPGTSHTPGTSATTPGGGNTPVTSGGTQKLENIDRVAFYAGVMFTVKSALQTKNMPDFSNGNPDQDDILKISVSVDYEGRSFQSGFIVNGRVKGPDGKVIETGIGHGLPKDEVPGIFGNPIQLSDAAFYFEVPNAVKITEWTLVIGELNEVQVEIPLSGTYDPTLSQEIPHTMGLNQQVTYSGGRITGVITKIVTVTWNPCGCQAPKGMRFLRVYFHVTNNTQAPVEVGDGLVPQYVLIYPNGDRMLADTRYNFPISVDVNGQESKDVGFDSWVIPTAPAAYVMKFLNPDGSVVGTIDLGTI